MPAAPRTEWQQWHCFQKYNFSELLIEILVCTLDCILFWLKGNVKGTCVQDMDQSILLMLYSINTNNARLVYFLSACSLSKLTTCFIFWIFIAGVSGILLLFGRVSKYLWLSLIYKIPYVLKTIVTVILVTSMVDSKVTSVFTPCEKLLTFLQIITPPLWSSFD